MMYIECKADRALVKSITNLSGREIEHAGNKPGVCKKLKKQRKSKGLVDEDPGSTPPTYMKKLQLESDLPQHDLKRLRDNPNDNNLIVLCPRLEEWILKTARDANVTVRRYNLPDNARKLHREINISMDKFEGLLGELKNKNPQRLRDLKRLLEE